MVVKISNPANSYMKAFHIEAFKKDSLGEEETDLKFGTDFDWWREACRGWQLGSSVMQCVKAGLHNAHPGGIMKISMIRTDLYERTVWEKKLSDQVWVRWWRALNSLLRNLTIVSPLKVYLSKIKLNASELCIWCIWTGRDLVRPSTPSPCSQYNKVLYQPGQVVVLLERSNSLVK